MGSLEAAVKMNWLIMAVAGLTSGALGAMGLGGGGILIIYLKVFTNVEQLRAQGINLLFFIPMAVVSAIIYSRKGLISWKVVIPASIAGIPGAMLGAYLSSFIGGELLAKAFGLLLFVIGITQIIKKDTK